MTKRGMAPEMKDGMQKLRDRGWSQHDIAKEFGISQMSVSMYLNPDVKKRSRVFLWKYQWKLKLEVITLLGGKCSNCGNTDLRVLQVNHLNGDGRKELKKYGGGCGFYRAILTGRRATDDLDIRCANCNILYEFKVGRRRSPYKVAGH